MTGVRRGVTAAGMRPSGSASERRAELRLEQASESPPALRALLARMPKGGDLHMHLSGAVYAETFVQDGRDDLLCWSSAKTSFVANVGTTRSIPPQPVCGEGSVSAGTAFTDQHTYDAMIDAFSMRSFLPSPGYSGHDQFFDTFLRFDPMGTASARHGGAWLDQLATRAAAQNEQYLEIMHTPNLVNAIELAKAVEWPTTPTTMAAFGQETTGTSDAELAEARHAMLASSGFTEELAEDRKEFHKALAIRRQLEHCDEANATAGCMVEIRFLFQVLRANPPAFVFAQTLLAFESAQHELDERGSDAAGPVVVGLNFVQPEDNRVAMAEYTRQMRMIGYLHELYPRVHLALHAGELASGMVAPEGLRFHIRQALEIAHAERIGHGVDVMEEEDAEGLLKELASRDVPIEINLTSNDVILNVKGQQHPLPLYRAAGVPVTLSTDDEGVSRIDLTHEYVCAVLEFHLTYRELKQIVRYSLSYSFLPGESLWRDRTATHVVAACAQDTPGAARRAASCASFLRQSSRAAQQWELERRFDIFEASVK